MADLARLAEEKGAWVSVPFMNRYSFWAATAKRMIADGEFVVSAVLSYRAHEAEVEDYALVTMRTPSGVLIHNEVGCTLPTWPANQTDGEQKVAGERLLLRQGAGGLQILGPGREETIPQPPGWVSGYPRAVREALEAYGRADPPPIPPSECAHAVRLIFDACGKAGVQGCRGLAQKSRARTVRGALSSE